MGKASNVKVLKALDERKISFFHFKAIIISGMGFFTDAYDLFSIGLLTKLIGRIYYSTAGAKKPGTIPITTNSWLTAASLVGTLLGQLLFGWLGDAFGRKSAYGVTLLIMVGASLCSGLSFGSTPTSVLTTLILFRILLGIGVGGDYPLSATIMSEYASKAYRGAFIAAVFSMQGIGYLFAATMVICVCGGLNRTYPSEPWSVVGIASTRLPYADFAWRTVLMLALVPTALTFYWRSRLPETARYTALVEKNAKKVAADMSYVLEEDFGEHDGAVHHPAEGKEVKVTTGDVVAKLEHVKSIWSFAGWDLPRNVPEDQQTFGWFLKHFGVHLIGTCGSWFFLDIAFYSQNLFQNTVFTTIGWLPPAASMNALQEAYKIARCQALVALWSTIPGYWFTVAFIEIIGRWWIQLMGFFFMTLFMLILAIDYNHLLHNTAAFVAMYSLTFFFANFGPNATTFVVPAEIFPAKFRSTAHGISAACGKAGAIVGSFGFLYASQSTDPLKSAPYPAGIGLQNSLYILAATNCLGFLCTFLIPEPLGTSLEDTEVDTESEAPTV